MQRNVQLNESVTKSRVEALNLYFFLYQPVNNIIIRFESNQRNLFHFRVLWNPNVIFSD